MSGNLVFIRMGLHLVILTIAILLALDLLGMIPRTTSDLSASRIQLCESIALESTAAASRQDFSAVRKMFDAVVQRSEDVRSVGLRQNESDRLVVATADHQRLWTPESNVGSTMTHARLPIAKRGEPWGTIEVRFESAESQGLLSSLWDYPLFRVILFFSVAGFVVYTFYMRRALRYLDPTTVIPPRVQATLDVMTEGVVLLDANERIVLANSTFAEKLGRSSDSLMGIKASELGWLVPKSLEQARSLPWKHALEDAAAHTGTPLCVKVGENEYETFVVNGAPIVEESGKARGAIATFDSITVLERKTEQLEKAMAMLEKSRDEARLRNEELQVLATCDPLTGLSNRRAFMSRAELEFAAAIRNQKEMFCVMVDIDHFKLVNDKHGHSMGDDVICRLAQGLSAVCQNRETLCRFGGEEFCMLLTDIEMEAAVKFVENLRRTVAAQGFAPIPITASFGLSAISFGAPRFYDLLDQSDQALYASKEKGRNCLTRFDEI